MRSIDQKFQEADLIVKEAKAMRILQKAYFKSVWEKDEGRKKILLDQSKAQERKVDNMIVQYYESSEGKLF